MNSAFRTIDLGTYILAPVLVGQLMTFLSPVAAAAFMAGWNIISLAVEYTLLRRVYRSVPQLARPKVQDVVDAAEPPMSEMQELKRPELLQEVPLNEEKVVRAEGGAVNGTDGAVTAGLLRSDAAREEGQARKER